MVKSKISRAKKIYQQDGLFDLLNSTRNHVVRSAACDCKKIKYKIKWGRACPTPTDVIYINPEDITYCAPTLVGPEYELDKDCCHVVDGDWDTYCDFEGWIYKRQFKNKANITEPQLIPFEQYAFYDSLKQHFLNDIPWEETKMYKWAMENLEASARYSCEKEVKTWLQGIDELYKRIDDNEYLTQRELVAEGVIEKSTPFPEYNEVNVNITRDGEFILGINGRHRTSIAKILGLEEIPVRVFARHSNWQKIRYNHYSSPVSNIPEPIKSYHSHPDIQGLRES